MRVTHQLIKQSVLNNLNRNLTQMQSLQTKLSSGKALSKPSDDPIKVAEVMGYNNTLDANEQYQKNIFAAKSWMGVTEDALGGIEDVLQRARELALSAVNGTMSDEARNAVAMEIEELTNILVQQGNTSYQGRYIFAGFQTTTLPFSRDKTLLESGAETSVVYHGDQGKISWELAPNVSVQGNIDGQKLFLHEGTFATLEKLTKALEDGDQDVVGDSVTELSTAIEHVLDQTAKIGAITSGLDLTKEKYLSEELNFIELRSQLEDIDLAETYIKFSMLENVYQASLSAGARIIQPSLLDFLR